MSKIRERAIEGMKEGDTFTITRTFTEDDTMAFADITRDYNPVHFDDRYAKAKNLKGRICHGLLVGSMITEFGGQVGVLAYDFRYLFKRPVYFGDTITCTMTLNKVYDDGRMEATGILKNQDDKVVLEVIAKAINPSQVEREIMAEMVAEGDLTNKIRDEI
jgi:3-hydroxybutyryl-CoA dehydratase